MAWGYLVLAGLFEVAWAVGLKYSDGFTRPWPSMITILSICASMGLLALALKSIPVGTGYAIWTGIGIAGTAVLGMVLFAESASATRLISLLLIVAGILGLRASS
ncbi:MAG: quaternary ammonium compound efflux SMR transporter SugE [Nitrospiraceae bacterium]|nr:quaternary ammonium compound efflux SMR transporter SugE [Nitrospiraceae bacterium]